MIEERSLECPLQITHRVTLSPSLLAGVFAQLIRASVNFSFAWIFGALARDTSFQLNFSIFVTFAELLFFYDFLAVLIQYL